MQQVQRKIMGHGAIVLFIGLLAGFMLAFGLIGGLEIFPGMIVEMPYYGTTDGWVRAHTGGVTNGLMMLGVALALPYVQPDDRLLKLTSFGIIFAGYGNTAFYWFGNASGSRALSFADNPLGASNIFGMIGYGWALLAGAITLYILALFARNLLRG